MRQLRCFVAVAEELNFSRAAERSNVTQSYLSRLIMDLEAHLRVPLLIRRRGRREVQLTDAGRAFLIRARRILNELNLARHEVEAAAHKVPDVLRLGLSDSARHGPWPEIVRQFQTLRPHVRLEWNELPFVRDHLHDLHAGHLDATFVTPGEQDPELETHVITRTDHVVLLAATHPLATLKEVPLGLLADQLTLPWDGELNPGLHGHIVRSCQVAGFVPPMTPGIHGVASPQTVLRLAAEGTHAFLVDPGLLTPLPPGAVTRPVVRPSVPCEIALVWRRDDPNPLLEDLRRSVPAFPAAFPPAPEAWERRGEQERVAC